MSVRTRWARLVAQAAVREPATGLALMRIGIGLTVLLALLSIVRHGLLEVLFVDVAHGGTWPLRITWPAALLGGPSPAAAWTLLASAAIGSTGLVVGLAGRASAALALFGWMGLTRLHPEAGGSYDALVCNALWLLVLAPATATLSLDCRRRTGRFTSEDPVAAWTRYLAIYQVVLVYFTSGIQKVSAHWVPGGDHAALWYILQWPAWRRFDPVLPSWAFPLTQVATVATWCFEVAAPVWLLALWWHATADRPGRLRAWSNRLGMRWWFFGLGVALHVGTWILLEVGPFSPAALSLYACLLAPSDYARLRAFFTTRRAAAGDRYS